MIHMFNIYHRPTKYCIVFIYNNISDFFFILVFFGLVSIIDKLIDTLTGNGRIC